MSNKNKNNFQEAEFIQREQEVEVIQEEKPIVEEIIEAKKPIAEESVQEAPVVEKASVIKTEKEIKAEKEIKPVIEEAKVVKEEPKTNKVLANKQRFKVILITKDGCIAVDEKNNNKRFYGSLYLRKNVGEQFEE